MKYDPKEDQLIVKPILDIRADFVYVSHFLSRAHRVFPLSLVLLTGVLYGR